MPRIAGLCLLCCLSAAPAVSQDADVQAANLLKQAEAADQAKDYRQSASLYRRVLRLVQETDRAGVEYNLACSQALAGDRAAALDMLGEAVEDGYTDRKDTATDPDLASLHADPRWQPLLERMRVFSAEQDARWGDVAFATPKAGDLSDADKLAGLSELWAQARYGFANFWHVSQLDWNQSYRDYIPQVLATRSTAEYYRVLQRFYAQLQDGHSNVYPPEQLQNKVSRLSLRTRLVDGHLLVIGSREPGANLQGLKPGDEILTVNGEPAIAWAQHNVAPYVSASTEQDRDTRTYEYVPFLAPLGTRFTLVAQTPAGEQTTHLFQVAPAAPAHKAPFEMRLLPGNVAYIALNGFDDDTAAKEWDKHWPEISKATGLILDLRENGGGSDSVGYAILATLVRKPTPTGLSRSTRWVASYRAWGKAETPVRFPVNMLEPDPVRRFDGPVVLLTSPRTYSAAENMVVAFREAHRGKIFGEPTGGSTGQPLTFKLPGGGTARICTKHDSFADGREFVGVGVQPDVAVHLTRADYVAGRDSVLDAALHSLQAKP